MRSWISYPGLEKTKDFGTLYINVRRKGKGKGEEERRTGEGRLEDVSHSSREIPNSEML